MQAVKEVRAREGCGLKRIARRLVLVATVCALLAIILEFGTLVGAPLLTPLNLDHWRLKRIAIFFCFLVAVYAFWSVTKDRQMEGLSVKVCSWWLEAGASARVVSIVGVVAALPVLLVLSPPRRVGSWGDGYDFRVPLIAAVAVFAAALLLLYREKIARQLEWGFLIISLSFGTLMCACMPVIAEVTWDGQIHFNSANAVSYVLDAEYSGADVLMTRFDAVLILDLLESGDVAAIWNPKQDAESVAAANEVMLVFDDSGFESVVGARRYGDTTWVSAASVGYLPLAAGLWTGRLLHLDCLGRFFLARMCSIVFHSVVFFLAIRRLHSGKTIVAALGLLPTPMLTAANFSYDPWCYALITYAFARYVGVLQSGSVFRRCDAWAIYGCFFLGALVKAVVFPLLLIMFVAPRRSFSSRKSEVRFRMAAIMVVLALLSSFAVPFIASGAAGGDVRGGANVSSAGQVAFILANPLSFLGILGEFCIGFFSPLNVVEGNNAFSGFPYLVMDPSRVACTAVVEWLVLVCAVLVDRDERDKAYRGPATKVACVVGACCAFALVATALYVSFTPVGYPGIGGVQPRYVLPFLAAVFLVFANFRNGPLLPEGRHVYAKAFLGVEWAIMAFVMIMMFVMSF